MHEPTRDDLDGAIDATIRGMLRVEPNATFDTRVRARVAARPAIGGWPRLAAAAACAVLAAAVLSGVLRWLEPAADTDAPGAAAQQPSSPAPSARNGGNQPGTPSTDVHNPARRQTMAPAPGPAPTPRPAAPSAAGALGRGDIRAVSPAQSGVTIRREEPLVEVAPLPPIEPLTIASIPRETASPQARLIVPLEPIAAIEIAPLSPSQWRE